MKIFKHFFLWAAFAGLSLGGSCGDHSSRPEQAGRFEEAPHESHPTEEEIAEKFETAKKEALDAANNAIAAGVLLKASVAGGGQTLSVRTQALIDTADLALQQAKAAETAEEACFIRDNALETARRLQNLLDAASLFETKEEEDTDLEY